MLLSMPEVFLLFPRAYYYKSGGNFLAHQASRVNGAAGSSALKKEGPFGPLFPFTRIFPKEPQGEAAVGSWRMLQDQSVSSCFMLLTGTGSSGSPNSASEGSMVSSFTRTAMTSKRQREGKISK